MEIIEGTALSNLCDYSFGDHLGALEPNVLKGGFAKYAHPENKEFFDLCKKFEGKVMTLFIDNIRLYRRTLEVNTGWEEKYIMHLLETNDLLLICASLPKNKFVIFCSHEDTPIDSTIQIPDNVLGIHAVNAEFFGGKIHPFPYGVQREINRAGDVPDNRIEVLKREIGKVQEPTKLLYINCGIGRNPDRLPLTDFEGLEWVTTRFNKDSAYYGYDRYEDFLNEMRDHKFMICPIGHGLDCHRNWELLYMRRVPVMKDSPYFRELMRGFPVLFVKEWKDVTKELLEASDHLYQEAQVMHLERLDLNVMFKEIMATYGI